MWVAHGRRPRVKGKGLRTRQRILQQTAYLLGSEPYLSVFLSFLCIALYILVKDDRTDS